MIIDHGNFKVSLSWVKPPIVYNGLSLLLNTIHRDGFAYSIIFLYDTKMLHELLVSIRHGPELKVQYTQSIKSFLERKTQPQLSHELASCHCNMKTTHLYNNPSLEMISKWRKKMTLKIEKNSEIKLKNNKNMDITWEENIDLCLWT
jgi:hypothetical protein